jgi:hypothetical protein
MIPTKLTADQLDQVLKLVVLTPGKEYAAARICRRLAFTPGVRTRTVNQDCSVGNISDIVNKSINPLIDGMGLYVACIKPMKAFHNRHGQRTGEMLWCFFRDVDADNDSDYQASNLRADLDNIHDQHPELNRWAQAIQGVE